MTLTSRSQTYLLASSLALVLVAPVVAGAQSHETAMLANAPQPPQAARESSHPGPVVLPHAAVSPPAPAPSQASHEAHAASGHESSPPPVSHGAMTESPPEEVLPVVSPAPLAPEASSRGVAEDEAQPLTQLYQENKTTGASQFTNPAYLIKVSGVLLVLLTLAFAVMKLMVKSRGAEAPLVPFRSVGEVSTSEDQGDQPAQAQKARWFETLFAAPKTKAAQRLAPRIIARTKLGPTKEIHILAVGQKRLVVGSTPQQMTLLTSWDEGMSENVVETAPAPEPSGVHRKYLNAPQTDAYGSWVSPTVPDVEEVVMLDDYEDQFPGSG